MLGRRGSERHQLVCKTSTPSCSWWSIGRHWLGSATAGRRVRELLALPPPRDAEPFKRSVSTNTRQRGRLLCSGERQHGSRAAQLQALRPVCCHLFFLVLKEIARCRIVPRFLPAQNSSESHSVLPAGEQLFHTGLLLGEELRLSFWLGGRQLSLPSGPTVMECRMQPATGQYQFEVGGRCH